MNPFYKEYPIGLHIARILLKHSSYNHILHGVGTTETPPYWIDMSKLFEMYVFEKLRIQFGDDVIYHPHFRGQEPDYLILQRDERPPYIVDAKYKRYSERPIETDDIRQVSGYARMKAVRSKLQVVDNSLIPCVIIYPDQEMDDELADYNEWTDEGRYLDIFKTGIKLPLI